MEIALRKRNYFVIMLLGVFVHAFGTGPQPQATFSQYNNSDIKSIGIYIHPTHEKQRDRMTYNLTSLYFMTLGYKVINLDKKLQTAGRLKRNYKKNIKTIFSANDTSHQKIDLLVSIRPEWKNRYVTIPIAHKQGIRTHTFLTRWELPVMKMKLDIIDVAGQTTIFSGESADTLRIKEIDAGKDRTMDVSAIPLRWLVQRNFANLITDFPPCSQPENVEAQYRFPVIFYADQVYRHHHRRDWKSILERRLVFTNDIFKRQFGIEFYIREFHEWNTKRQDSLEFLIGQLIEDAKSKQNAIVIGATLDQLLVINWFDRNTLGIAYDLNNSVVIKDLPTTKKLRIWDSLDETITLVHELGHVFGAIHILDPASVMYPSMGTMSYEFDDYNKAIVNYAKDNFDKFESARQLAGYVKNLIDIHHSFDTKNVFFAGNIGSIAYQYTSMGNSIDSLSIILSDSSLYYAARGYIFFEKEEWEKAKQCYRKSVKFNPDFASAYVYLGNIYEELDDHYEAIKYWRKAEKKGFKSASIRSW